MNTRKILSSLKKIANILDDNLFIKEADYITRIMVKISNEDPETKIFDDIYSTDDDVTKQIKERDLRSHKIILEYQIDDQELKSKEYITKITNTDIIKRASLEFVIDSNRLSSGNGFTINIKAINPRSNEKMWEVEYLIEVEDDERITFHASPMISKYNYEMEDITENTGSDFIKDTMQRAMQKQKTEKMEDPFVRSIREKLKNMPGDLREKVYNVALEELQFDSDSDYETISQKANSIADTFKSSDNQTIEYLAYLIEDAAYSDF